MAACAYGRFGSERACLAVSHFVSDIARIQRQIETKQTHRTHLVCTRNDGADKRKDRARDGKGQEARDKHRMSFVHSLFVCLISQHGIFVCISFCWRTDFTLHDQIYLFQFLAAPLITSVFVFFFLGLCIEIKLII